LLGFRNEPKAYHSDDHTMKKEKVLDHLHLTEQIHDLKNHLLYQEKTNKSFQEQLIAKDKEMVKLKNDLEEVVSRFSFLFIIIYLFIFLFLMTIFAFNSHFLVSSEGKDSEVNARATDWKGQRNSQIEK
jgi:hypothetical protein